MDKNEIIETLQKPEINWKKLKNKRILVNSAISIFNNPEMIPEIIELRILDISPSGKYVKTENIITKEIDWKATNMFKFGFYKIIESLSKKSSRSSTK